MLSRNPGLLANPSFLTQNRKMAVAEEIVCEFHGSGLSVARHPW